MNIQITEGHEAIIKKYLKGSKNLLVMVDEDTHNVCAILKGKTLFDTLPVAVMEETNCEEVKSIVLSFIKGNYTIDCKCILKQEDDEDEEKTFNLMPLLIPFGNQIQ